MSSGFPSSSSLFQSVTSTIKSCWGNNLSTIVSSSGDWSLHAPGSGKLWMAHSVYDDQPAIVPSVVKPNVTLEVIPRNAKDTVTILALVPTKTVVSEKDPIQRDKFFTDTSLNSAFPYSRNNFVMDAHPINPPYPCASTMDSLNQGCRSNCRQLPSNNMYQHELLINCNSNTVIMTRLSAKNIKSHIKNLFHKDQHIANSVANKRSK